MKILLVEDDDAIASLLALNLKREGYRNFVRARNGKEAVVLLQEAYLLKGSSLEEHVMLLDIRMPEMDGIEVLRWRQKQNDYRIPVIMLTTSENPDEVKLCYELGCNMYVKKPVNYQDFTTVIKNIMAFFTVCRMPKLGLD